MRKLKRLCQLSRRELGVFVGALCLLPATRLSVSLCGYQRTRRWLEKAFPAPGPSFLDLRSVRLQADRDRPAEAGYSEMVKTALAEQTLSMVRAAAANGLFRTTCLPRSLVLWALLRRQGLSPELRFGARKKARAFEAHAWLELDQMVLDPSIRMNETFVPFEMRTTLR